jgi:EAL and modified HD-GYP domain-containing signal transduction protein
LQELPRQVLPCFKYSIIDLADDRRINDPSAPAGVTRSIGHVQSGVRTVADMEASFQRGAEAVLGWPIDDAVTTTAARSGKNVAAPGMQAIVELIRQVDKEETIEKLEATLKRDPALAFKLLRYINSPAFGLRVEISSFRHAIMMLGYQRLKRWLALLLATASKDVNLKPVMFAAVRRGLLMEELVRSSGDEEMRNEMFICGVFSLLDRMFQQPFKQLLESIPVPEGVRQALADNTGPYQPYIELVQAVEGEALFEFRDAADKLMMSVSEINRAQLRALMAAAELE